MFVVDFSNFGSLKSTETAEIYDIDAIYVDFSNFGSLKSTETFNAAVETLQITLFQQFRLVEEH